MVGISFYSEVYNCNQTKEGKMNMKKKILLGLVLILCCFTGCSSNSSKNRDDNNPPEIKMSDIDWSVKSGIIDDERKLTFSYKNNIDYTIAYIELTFTRKDMVLDDSNSDINIYQWSSNDMAKKTAKPNLDCVVVNSDDNAYFSFNGYGVSRRQFEAYVEKVMDSYCEFMKKYNKSSDTSSMIKDYADYMEKYSDAVEKFQKIKNDNLNSDELSYYTEIQVRVTKKLADIQ